MINYKSILILFTGLLLNACNPEMGRLPLESDVGCLRKELSSPDHPSFHMAANFCQKTKNHILQPLNLKNAPDLQKKAEKAGIAHCS
ncbi:hypothetical protein H3T50_05565 [Commensalibacter sp. M0134]|uniref:hypothetical protein n=1 Tax=Commensalibacter TaxID=1079922 RepID=UPI0018DC32D8|nr:hypothetical protein [Commensalibacter sp. M0134]MBI0070021.1 hypothetical protein [Commensalibacter sp. M0133]MBI0080376.1 hypothetical protein [Commensalibacter melissae]